MSDYARFKAELASIPELVYLNGKYLARERAQVSVFDRGFLFGEGLIESMHAYFLKVPFIEAHYERLRRGAEFMGIDLSVSLEDFSTITYRLLNKNCLSKACVRFTVTAGVGPQILPSSHGLPPTVLAFLRPMPESLNRLRERGVSVAVSAERRGFEEYRRFKTTAYLDSLRQRAAARAQGADDMVILDVQGRVCESSTSNIFVVKDGQLFTPPLHLPILGGIARATIFDVCRRLDIGCHEKILERADLLAADEIFLTNAVVEVLPVVKVEGQAVGGGVPGGVTLRVIKGYAELIESMVL